jgi:hypothetical protein
MMLCHVVIIYMDVKIININYNRLTYLNKYEASFKYLQIYQKQGL